MAGRIAKRVAARRFRLRAAAVRKAPPMSPDIGFSKDGAGGLVPPAGCACFAGLAGWRGPARALLGSPALLPASGAAERRMVSLITTAWLARRLERQSEASGQRAIPGPGGEEPAVLDPPGRPQDLAARARHDVVLSVFADPTPWHGAADRLRLGRAHGREAAPLEGAKDLALGVAGSGGHRGDRHTGRSHGRVDPARDDLPLVGLAGCHVDVAHQAALVVHHACAAFRPARAAGCARSPPAWHRGRWCGPASTCRPRRPPRRVGPRGSPS